MSAGKYLATAGDCVACHTRPGGKPFEGGLAIETPFGTIYTPNITPSEQDGIGAFSDRDFLRALQHGISPSGSPYYPAFPYTSYTKVDDEDLLAIKAYLMSVEPSSYRPPKTHLRWPFSIRDLMFGWQDLYLNAERYNADPNRGDDWNRGAYLVEGLGHCGECHTPRNLAGATEKSKAMTGAVIDGWYAPNLTDALDAGLERWSVDELAAFLGTGIAKTAHDSDPNGTGDAPVTEALGPMAEVVHDSLSKLTKADLYAMAVYLKDLPAKTEPTHQPPAPNRLSAADEESGRDLYMAHCSACHQDHGQGRTPYFPALRGNPAVTITEPNDVIKTLLLGAPADPSDAFSPYVVMPAFGSILTDEQIATVASYIRASWGNDAAPVQSADVKVLR
ncbi:c-type cytochrome [Thiocapsa bogorovii]|uniref:c-type cytochrome n=1 Tax=Thiocapsa bogorovii TaxID=521689 RepID=UPI001E511259|nr:c-type cytochrome [Thiocapsa bogorovii]UHD17602.1 cytochrome c [Thiocapsa bogorovii]